MEILIAEDEPVIARRVERLVKEILGERITRIKICTTLEEAKSYLLVQQIDLLFLDLNLKGRDGFDLLEDTQAGSFYTVIISAFSNRAIKAFEYPVIDFIKKPFDKERLERTFKKLNDFDSKHAFSSKFLSVKRGGEIKLIDIDEIIYIKGAGVYSELFLRNRQRELHHQNLEKIDRVLPSSFVRIHKSFIVNIYFTDKIIAHGGSKYTLFLKNGDRLPVSRNRYQTIKDLLTHC